MRRVTLLLSGVPQFITLRDLSYNLDRLFNTNEIDTFKVRDLPNHPQTNKRQIALDFRTGYEAMAAQEKLEGYTYELENGTEYTLHAKINKFEEYMCSESPEYGSHWYGDSWMGFAVMPNVSDGAIYRAHTRLDAQLELLEKQKLVLEKEKELLNERQRLKRKYGSTYSSLYEGSLTLHTGNNQPCDLETEISPKRSRSVSRENRALDTHRSRSKDTGYKLPQIEWYDEHTKTRELRSYSGERSRSPAYSRDRKSNSRELRDRRYPASRHREQRSRSNDRDRYRRSTSRERGVGPRSRSKERLAHSRELRLNEHRCYRSRSRERLSYRRSRSKDRIPYRRSRSRDETHRNYAPAMSRSDWDHSRRLRSPDRSTNQLAIMSKSPRRRSPSEWSIDSLKATGTRTDNTKHEDIRKKEVIIKVEKDSKNTATEVDSAKENKTDNNTHKMKDKERKKIDKYNSKLRKAEKTALRVRALSKDIMILVAIVVDEIIDRDIIRISASNKANLIKTLEALVQDRLEPIARLRKTDDNEVLKKYKLKYPMEDDLKRIKQMLDGIPKLEMKEPEATVTVCAESENNVTDVVTLDVDSTTAQQCDTDLTPIIVKPVETTDSDNGPQIKQESTEEPIIIIDLDSAEKPVPKHPQFVVVINTIVKNMNKIIRSNNLDTEIKLNELKYVLRQILRNMLKGQGFLPREEIIRKFREAYPMENDEEFVRNTIKDIRDGKYPGLSGYVGDTIDNDCTDDVVLIEKQYDVVTVADSDDDELEKKSKIEVINLDCEPTQDNHGPANSQTKPNSSPSDPMPDSTHNHVKSAFNVDQRNSGSANSGQGKDSTNATQTKIDLANSGQRIGLANNIQAKTVSDLEEANIAANIGQANVEPAEMETTNPTQEKIARGRDTPELSSPGQTKTSPVNPGQVMTRLSNLIQTNTDLAKVCPTKIWSAKPGKKIGVANPIQAMTGLARLAGPGQAKKVPNNPSQTYKGPTNPVQTNKNPNDPGQNNKVPNNLGCTNKGPNNPGQTNKCPINPSQTNKDPNNPAQTSKGSNNPGQTNKGPNYPGQPNKGSNNPAQPNKGPNNPNQVNKAPNNPCQTHKDPNNPCQIAKGPNNPAQTIKGPNNSAQTNKGPNNPVQAKSPNNPVQAKAPNNPGQAKIGPNNPGQAKGTNNPCQAKKGPNNPSQVKNSPQNPGQVKKGPNNPGQAWDPNNPGPAKPVPVYYTVPVNTGFAYHSQAMIGPFCGQTGVASDKENQKMASLENTIQNLESKEKETPDNNKTSQHKEDSKENEENDNNLKVTAITIVTSLNELIAKTNVNEPKDVSIDEIKKEIEIDGEAELDESSLDITDSGPRVTSITIMTSDVELFSLGQGRKEVNEIKNETDVYYDAEDNLANDIERAFDDVNFGNSQSEHIQRNSVNSEQFDSVNSKQLSSKTPVLPQDNRTVQDDEETIESIVKYVASMY